MRICFYERRCIGVTKIQKNKIFHVDPKLPQRGGHFILAEALKLFGKTLRKLKKLDKIFGPMWKILNYEFFDTQ